MTELDAKKITAKSNIDRWAGHIRSDYISLGSGQDLAYLVKENDARVCLADPSPDATDYPMIAAEVGITGATLTDVATAVVTKANEWKIISGAIEAVRLGTKQAVDAATTEAEVDAVCAAINWPTLS